tara:strand:- start:708 stop:1277 length:570 start_codon:yes stop_codon:yes gene_type:complete
MGIAEQECFVRELKERGLTKDAFANELGTKTFGKPACKWICVPGRVPTLPGTYTANTTDEGTILVRVAGNLPSVAVKTSDYLDIMRDNALKAMTIDGKNRRLDGYSVKKEVLDEQDCAALNSCDWSQICQRFSIKGSFKPESSSIWKYLEMVCLLQGCDVLVDLDPSEHADTSKMRLLYAYEFMKLLNK